MAETAVRGGGTTLLGQAARILIQLISLVVLARLLGPSSYGFIGEVVAIIGVGEVLRDFGLSDASIQARSVTNQQRSNLFWINLGIGASLTIITIAISKPISNFYGDQEIESLTIALSATFLLNGFATQFRANLVRALRFQQIAIIDVLAQLGGLLTALLSCLFTRSFWPLALQQLAVAVIGAIAVALTSRWRPIRYDRHTSTRVFISYGANLGLVQTIVYLTRNIDSIIIGRRFGVHALGIYERAFAILMLPLNQLNAPVTRVALPTLARLQDHSQQYQRFLYKGQAILLQSSLGLFAFAAPNAPTLFRSVLGADWSPSVHIFQVFCIAGAVEVAAYPAYWVFLSLGLTRSALHFGIVTRPLVIAGIALGALHSPLGVAIGYAVGLTIVWPIEIFWVNRAAPAIDCRPLLFDGLVSIGGFGLVSAANFCVLAMFPVSNNGGSLLLGLVTFVSAFIITQLAFPPFGRQARTLRRTLRQFVSRRMPKITRE